MKVEDSRPKPRLSIADVRRALGIDERYPDSRPSELPRLHRALRRRRAKNAVAKQSRKRNR